MENDCALFLLHPHTLIPIVYCHEEICKLQMNHPRLSTAETSMVTSKPIENYKNGLLILVTIIQMS